MVRIGQVLGIGHNPNSWSDHMGKYSPENLQKIYMHAKVIWTLGETQTPDLGLGSTKMVMTVASEVKDSLHTHKVDLKDIYSEPPLDGGPRVA